MELCARILRCSQRYFLMKAERNASRNLIDDLVEHYTKNNEEGGVMNDKNCYDGLSSDRCNASTEELSKCPWIVFLMKDLSSSFGIKETMTSIRHLGDIAKMSKRQLQHECTAENMRF